LEQTLLASHLWPNNGLLQRAILVMLGHLLDMKEGVLFIFMLFSGNLWHNFWRAIYADQSERANFKN